MSLTICSHLNVISESINKHALYVRASMHHATAAAKGKSDSISTLSALPGQSTCLNTPVH